MDQELLERPRTRELVENWAVWRDAGDGDRFRTVWHDGGVMMATWTQGTADEFIRASIAQTKMTISQHAEIHGVVS